MKPQSSILACLSLCALLFGCKSESPEKLNPVLPPPTPPNEWVQTSQLPGSVAVYSFAIDGDEVFVGTYGGGVFLSRDNGDTWTNITNGLPDSVVRCVAIERTTDGTFIFASSSTRLFRSSDNGTTWSLLKDGGSGYVSVDVIQHGTSNADIFAGEAPMVVGGILDHFTYGGGQFHSTDHGSSWNQVSDGLPSSHSPLSGIAPSPIGTDLFGYDLLNIYRSTNNGMTWLACTPLTSTNTAVVYLTSLASSPNTSGGLILFAGTDYDGVHVSVDFGLTWNNANAGLTDTAVFCISVKDSLVFVCTGTQGVFVGTTNGSHWRAINEGLTDKSIRVLASNSSYLFAGTNDGKVWRRPISAIIQQQ